MDELLDGIQQELGSAVSIESEAALNAHSDSVSRSP